MKKTIVAILLCAVTVLCSCQTAEKKTGYETLPQVSHTCTGESYSALWNIVEPAEDLPPENTTRTVTLFGKDITFNYTETVCGGMYRSTEILHRYTSEDNMYTIELRPSDNKLISYTQHFFIASNFEPGVPRNEEHLLMFAETDLPDLTDSKDYVFVSSDFDNENHTATAVFAKFIGDLRTTDTITLTYAQFGLASVEFCDPGAFDGIDKIEISEENLEQGIRGFVLKEVFNEDFDILSMSVTDRFISRSTDGRLVLVSDMNFNMLEKADDVSGENEFDIDIPLASYIE